MLHIGQAYQKDRYKINNDKNTKSKSFSYKTKIIDSTPDDNNLLETEIVVPLKYTSNVWLSLDLLLINCKIELDFSCPGNYIISEISRTAALTANPPTPPEPA